MNTLFGPRDVGSVLMDPPWMEAGGGQCQRGANWHYDLHSRKPAELHELIEQASPGRHLEIFARQGREGWLTWGNELEEEP